jgi:acid phosphatase
MNHVSSVSNGKSAPALRHAFERYRLWDAIMFAQTAAVDLHFRFSDRIFPMNKRFPLVAAILVVLLVSVISKGQQPAAQKPVPSSHQPVFIVDAPAERIPNLDFLKNEIRQYHDCTCKCGCYARDLDLQADRAIAFLRRRAARRRPDEKLAMVLDIDETSLSNYQELLGADFAFNRAAFDTWVDTAKAPAISGTLRLYKEAQRLGVSVFFITGRPDRQRAVTEQNLNEQGFQNWQGLTLRSPSTTRVPVGKYKSDGRAGIAAQGYKIVLNVGDQWSDLKGKPEAEFSVKYPDPFYFLP